MRKIALIIGAQKSGTTSLFHYLSQHPQICASDPKEPWFFSNDERFGKGIPFYFSLWDWQDQHRVGIEASTVYTMRPMYSDVVKRITQVEEADFSFLYIMRHPLKRIESHVIHSLSLGVLKQAEVTDHSIAFSNYAYQLDPFVEQFGRDKLHLLLLEDLQDNPQQELQKIYHFLDVETEVAGPDLERVYNNREANHFRLPPWLKQMYRTPALQATVGRLPPQLRRSVYQFMPAAQTYAFQLSEQDSQAILAQLQPDLIRLQREYGVDFQRQWQLPLV